MKNIWSPRAGRGHIMKNIWSPRAGRGHIFKIIYFVLGNTRGTVCQS